MLRLRLLFPLFITCLLIAAPAWGSGETASWEESRYKLSEKVGWYRLDDGSTRLMTWSSSGGLTLSDLDALEIMRLRPVSEEVFTARDERGSEYEVQFQREPSGEIAGFVWVDARGVEHQADKLRDIPYLQQEVRYRNGSVELVGLMILPSAPGPHPAVIFIPGLDDGARDALQYLYQADHLARNGIAVLIPDRRGTGKSAGDWESSTFNDLAGDVAAAARHLKSLDAIDPSQIGAIGMHEGGWIAPLAATVSKDISFLVSVSGSAVTPKEQIRHEISSDVRRYGTPDFLVPLIAYALEFRSTNKDEEWWERNGRFDAVEYWKEVSVPVLALYGSRGEREGLPVRRSVERLTEARDDGGNENFTIRVLDDTGHGMEDPDTGRIRAEYLDLLTGWIKTHAV